MIPNHAPSTAAIPYRALLGRSFHGGFRFWSVAVATGLALAWLHWPIPGSEALYSIVVWAAAIALSPIFMGSDSMLAQWGWLVGTCAWLPVVTAFRFAHLVAVHPNEDSV